MAREFRRVARNWEHPRDEHGESIPLVRSRCRRGVAYQWYETTTEGTPLSPVCPTLGAMAAWFVTHQDDPQAGIPSDFEGTPWTYDKALAYIQQDEW